MTIHILGFIRVYVFYTIPKRNIGKPEWIIQIISHFFDVRKAQVFLRKSKFHAHWKSMTIHIVGIFAVYMLYTTPNKNDGRPISFW